MCRINGLPLLIKINKYTTKGESNDILPLPHHLQHVVIDGLNHYYMSWK